MYAIVKHSGSQKKLTAGQKVLLDRLPNAVNEEIVLNQVVCLQSDKGLSVEASELKNAGVRVKVLEHCRGEKLRIRHFKRRKHHMKRQGHRQDYTQVEVLEVSANVAAAKKTETKAAKPAKTEAKVGAAEAAAKPSAKKTADKASTTAAAPKKTVAKKSSTAKSKGE